MNHTILWRRLDVPGHEFCKLHALDGGWGLTGTALFVDNSEPCKLDYQICRSSDWQTDTVLVEGRVGSQHVDLHMTVGENRRWKLNEAGCPAVAGCIDIDLGFSP